MAGEFLRFVVFQRENNFTATITQNAGTQSRWQLRQVLTGENVAHFHRTRHRESILQIHRELKELSQLINVNGQERAIFGGETGLVEG